MGVNKANGELAFQGKAAYWSSETCGATADIWSAEHKTEYCTGYVSEEACKSQDRCSWTEAGCTGRAFADVCPEQQRTGLLVFEPKPEDSMRKRFCLGLRQETEEVSVSAVHVMVRLLCNRYI